MGFKSKSQKVELEVGVIFDQYSDSELKPLFWSPSYSCIRLICNDPAMLILNFSLMQTN